MIDQPVRGTPKQVVHDSGIDDYLPRDERDSQIYALRSELAINREYMGTLKGILESLGVEVPEIPEQPSSTPD